MKKIFGWIVAALVLCTVPVFAGTDEVPKYFVKLSDGHVYMAIGYDSTIDGVVLDDDGRWQQRVEFREGSGLSIKESIAFRKALSKIKERLPEKSFFEIARFPEVPKYFAKLSDGHVYVAIGSGSSVQAAFDDLVVKFSKRQ